MQKTPWLQEESLVSFSLRDPSSSFHEEIITRGWVPGSGAQGLGLDHEGCTVLEAPGASLHKQNLRSDLGRSRVGSECRPGASWGGGVTEESVHRVRPHWHGRHEGARPSRGWREAAAPGWAVRTVASPSRGHTAPSFPPRGSSCVCRPALSSAWRSPGKRWPLGAPSAELCPPGRSTRPAGRLSSPLQPACAPSATAPRAPPLKPGAAGPSRRQAPGCGGPALTTRAGGFPTL